MSVPTNLIPTPITGLPEYTGSSTLGYMPYVIDGQTFKVQFTNIAAVGAVPSTRVIASGTGLAGGGDLSADRVISIAAGGVGVNQLSLTGVTAGTYGSGSDVPVLTVDATGRVTSATTAALSVTGFVPTSRTITAGSGLTGGGSLASDITLSANFSATTPLALGSATAGVAITLSRGDHVHPALDLSDTNQTQGALPLGRGGTGDALSPVAGAVVYSTGTKFALSALGSVGQVLVSNGTGAPVWTTLTGTGTVTSVNLTAGTGISVSGGPITTSGSINVVNTAPDQVVSLTGAGTTVVTGTYPSFTITSTDSAAGTVTSVNASGGTTGLSFTGGPITTSGTLTLGGTLAIANGGTGAIDAPTALTNLGAYPASNPSGFTSNVGTVTSVSGTGTVSGLSLSGTVTSTGSLTLGGTLAVLPSNFASQTANTVLAAPNGSAGTPTFRAIVAADVPTLNQNTTGTASNVTGIVAVLNGGTGASVAGTARTNLLAAGSGANTDITSIALTTGTVSATPTSGTDIVNKLYADSIASGINFHQSVRLATAAALPANTYNNGASGVGATLTANANGALTVDGVAAVAGNRILVKNEVTQANNGVYTVTQVGDGSTPYILTRATDFDSAGSGVDQIDAGDFFLVTAGSTQSNTSWVQQTPLPITVGTTAIVFTQFAAPVLYSAGTGLTLAGTVFSITNTGVSASTYGSASSVPVIAVNAQGQATSVTNTPIAIAATQITSGTFTVGQGGTGQSSYTDGQLLIGNSTGNTLTKATLTAGTNVSITNGSGAITINATDQYVGTVTSVSGTGTVSGLTLTGTVTTSGSLTLGGTLAVTASDFASQTAKTFLAAPNASAGVPSFRAIIPADVPTLNQNTTGTASNVTGTVAVANGGTGTTTAFTAGSVVFAGASGVYSQDNANLFWDDTNNRLGIGTATPAQKLQVSGSSTSPIAVSINNNDPGLSAGSKLSLAYNGSETGYILNQFDGGDFNNIYQANRGHLFLTATTERMRITSAGDVGIGTTSPVRPLHVFYNSTVVGAYSAVLQGAVGGYGAGVSFQSVLTGGALAEMARITADGESSWNTTASTQDAGLRFYTALDGTVAEKMRLDASGNVGIGTGTPVEKLRVEGNVIVPISKSFFSYTSDYGVGTPDSNGLQIFTNTSDVIRFGQRASGTFTERVRINASGNLLVGTSVDFGGRLTLIPAATPTTFAGGATLQIGEATNNTAYRLQMGYINHTTAGYVGSIQSYAGGVANNLILQGDGGNVGINTSAPGAKLETFNDVGGVNALRLNTNFASGNYVDINPYISGVSNGGFSISLNGTIRQVISYTGDVGIGTTAPVQKLHVVGLINSSDGASSRSVIGWTSAATWGGAGLQLINVDNSNLILGTNNTGRLLIDTNGNVGIGTSSPSYKFDVVNAGNLSARIRNANATTGLYSEILLETANTFNSASQAAIRGVSTNGGNSDIALTFGTSSGSVSTATERMRIDSSGNLLVGTTSASYSASGRGVAVLGGSASGLLGFQIGGVAKGYVGHFDTSMQVWNEAASPILFGTSATERARIDASGNFMVGCTGIDTDAPNVNASSYMGSGNYKARNSTAGFQYLQFYGTSVSSPIGSISNVSNTGVSYNVTSDARLKHDIVDAPDAASLIDAIQVRSFKWNADNSEQRYGFVAQELVTVAPEAVSQPADPDEMMGVDYSKLVPMLVKELQSLRARVAQLEGN